MSDRAPAYRSWAKTYGGDSDSSILKDLHRRVMKIEIAEHRLGEDRANLAKELAKSEANLLWLKAKVDTLEAFVIRISQK